MLFGRYTSLYSGLNEKIVSLIEEAAFLTRIGFYKEAQSLFESELADVQHLPVVILEWANSHHQQWGLGRTTEILENGLQVASIKDSNFHLDRDEYRLMSMFLAATKISSKGTLEPAIREINRVRNWLAKIPVSEYSDIQVSINSFRCR